MNILSENEDPCAQAPKCEEQQKSHLPDDILQIPS